VQLPREIANEAMMTMHGSIVPPGSAEQCRHDTNAAESAYMSRSVAPT
jgi:hypothetical protein